MNRHLKRLAKIVNKNKPKIEIWSMVASFGPEDTGLPMKIWVSTKTFSHGPRIKVHESVSVSISDTPSVKAGSGLSNADLKLVSQYIIKNKDILLQYWNEEITTPTLVAGLKKIYVGL